MTVAVFVNTAGVTTTRLNSYERTKIIELVDLCRNLIAYVSGSTTLPSSLAFNDYVVRLPDNLHDVVDRVALYDTNATQELTDD